MEQESKYRSTFRQNSITPLYQVCFFLAYRGKSLQVHQLWPIQDIIYTTLNVYNHPPNCHDNGFKDFRNFIKGLLSVILFELQMKPTIEPFK